MYEEPDALISLWDYGWCEHRIMQCLSNDPSIGVIERYLQSEEFGTSFIFPEPGNDPSLHGPFLRSAVNARDFVSIPLTEIIPKLKTICFDSPDTKPISQEQWSELELLTQSVIDRNAVAFQLALTVENSEAQHEWGWVILDFHEFIFASHDSDKIERLVIGYD